MKQRLINYLLSHVVKVIIPKDIIRESKDGIYLGETKITDLEIRALSAEAKALEKMRIWSIMNETVKQLSFEKGWKNATTMEQLNTAKTMYHVLDLQNSIIKSLKKKTT